MRISGNRLIKDLNNSLGMNAPGECRGNESRQIGPLLARVDLPLDPANRLHQIPQSRLQCGIAAYLAEGVGFEPTKDPKALNGFRA